MKITKIIALIFSLIFFAGCSDKNINKMVFDSNIESSYWSQSNSVVKFNNAHSGNYVCKINKDNAFSTSFELRAKDISDSPTNTFKASAWMMLTGDNSEQNLVLEIRDSSNQQTLEWLNTDAGDYIDDLNQWVKIDLIIDLTVNKRNNPHNIYRVYACNGKEDAVFVDDFQVAFE